MKHLDKNSTALLITDPQNDFLAESGVAYGLVKDNLAELDTVKNIESLLKIASENNWPIFISPHYYFEHDKKWQHRGALQKTIHEIDMYRVENKQGKVDLTGTGADFLESLKEYIYHEGTTITSPHKVYGPESNDLVLQLRMQGIQTVLIGGLAANLCTDSHMRELVEQGFEVYMIKDAVGAPGKAAYEAAMTNYELIANGVVSTAEVLRFLQSDG